MTYLITPGDRIFVAGHQGMAGSAICRALERGGYHQLLTASHSELDLLDCPAVEAWFANHQPTVVVVAAAKVGGIQANSLPGGLSSGEPQDPDPCDRNGLAFWCAAAVVPW